MYFLLRITLHAICTPLTSYFPNPIKIVPVCGSFHRLSRTWGHTSKRETCNFFYLIWMLIHLMLVPRNHGGTPLTPPTCSNGSSWKELERWTVVVQQRDPLHRPRGKFRVNRRRTRVTRDDSRTWILWTESRKVLSKQGEGDTHLLDWQ